MNTFTVRSSERKWRQKPRQRRKWRLYFQIISSFPVWKEGGGASVPSLHPHPSARTTPPKRTIFWVRLPLVQPLFALFATRGKSQIHSSLLPGLKTITLSSRSHKREVADASDPHPLKKKDKKVFNVDLDIKRNSNLCRMSAGKHKQLAKSLLGVNSHLLSCIFERRSMQHKETDRGPLILK